MSKQHDQTKGNTMGPSWRSTLTNLAPTDLAKVIAQLEGASAHVGEGTPAQKAQRLIEAAEAFGGFSVEDLEKVVTDLFPPA